MAIGLTNKFTWLQVYISPVYLIVYLISKVCIVMMYMQHRHMVCDEFHRHHYLDLDQNSSNNTYLSPLRHEFCNVDHRMVMLNIYFCYNDFHVFVCNVIIILNMIRSVCPFSFTEYFSVFALINDIIFSKFSFVRYC